MNWSGFVYYSRLLLAKAAESPNAESVGVIVIIALAIILGYVLSLYHIFTRKFKSDTTKLMMAIFAVMVNVIAGVMSIVNLSKLPFGIIWIFPIINLIYAFLLLFVLNRYQQYLTSDEDDDPKYLIIGLPILILFHILGYYVFSWNWTLTFSICVTYSMLFSNYAKTLKLFKPYAYPE
jgi:FlaA1/EpsC-like NDP-sugar epimerase